MALCHAYQSFDLIHLCEELLITTIQKLNLPFLVLNLLNCRFLVKVPHYTFKGRRSDNLKSGNLIVPRLHFLVQQANLIFKVHVDIL